MAKNESDEISIVPWKLYVGTALQCIVSFYLATFCMAIYFFTHGGATSTLLTVCMLVLYAVVIINCITLLIKRLSIAALMIVIPIAPFLVLVTVVSLIPVLEIFK